MTNSSSSALRLTLGYVLIASSYIAASTMLVASGAASFESAVQLELIKGFGFVVITGAGLGLFAWRRFAAHEREVERRGASERALLDAERRAIAGILSSAIAHDANNLLAVVCANLSAVRSELAENASERALVEETIESSMRLTQLIRRLRDVGKPAAPTQVPLVPQVAEACALARRHPDGKAVRIETELGAVEVHAEPILLLQLLLNLVLNAVVVQPRQSATGQVLVRCRADGDSRFARIEIHDDGPGFAGPLEVRAYRTGRADGTGLGLVSVLACVEALSGTIESGPSQVLSGACFTVRLPTPVVAADAAVG